MFDFLCRLKHNEIVRRHIGGFTLIELILVMAIISILSVIGITSFVQATVKSRDTQRKNDIEQIVRAIESFNNDVGRYPASDNNGWMTCPGFVSGQVVEGSCFGQISAYIKGNTAVYMQTVPTDPTSTQKYIYIPTADFSGFALYATLENTQDNDVVKHTGVVTNWDSDFPVGQAGSTCGSASCNYKVTETGLIRTK